MPSGLLQADRDAINFGESRPMSIYVGNLSYRATKDDITDVFTEYGTVKNVTVPLDRETERPRGFAFVELASDDEEDSAIAALDGAEWLGRQMRVNKARPREDSRPTPRPRPSSSVQSGF